MSDQDDNNVHPIPDQVLAERAAELKDKVAEAQTHPDESQVVVLAERQEPAKAPRVLAIANQKGGVGKTTTAINLGTALAAVGEKVLILDLDPQGNASTGVGIAEDARPVTSFNVLTGKASILAASAKTLVPNLSIVPANADLVGL